MTTAQIQIKSTLACLAGLTLVLLTVNRVAAAEINLDFIETAPGIYLHRGEHQQMSVENLGDIANIGFIVGRESVAVIDPGGSPQIGAAMRRALRQLTQLPISHVILTHIHPDHYFGVSAFSDVPHTVAHTKFASALAQRGDFYRNRFRELFSADDAPLSLVPNLPVDTMLSIDLGGRMLQIRAHPTAHTDNDLSVFDLNTRTLWASDLLFAERIPSLDGSLPGWIQVLQTLALLEPKQVIPGHGAPGSWRAVAEPQLNYLRRILRETRQYIAQNKKMSDAIRLIAASERGKWRLFDDHHPGNITKAYTELEWE